MRKKEQTSLQILKTAEKMFALRGVEGVSMREISTQAGQKNHSAANYHFVTKEALIDAILERHSAPIHVGYSEAMDAYDAKIAAGEKGSLRDLMSILVLPIVSKLDDEDGGSEYIMLCAMLAVHPTMPLEMRRIATTPPVMRLSKAMWPFVTDRPEFLFLRMARLAGTIYTSLVQYQRIAASGFAPVTRKDFEEDLVDCLTAMVAPDVQ